MLMMRPYRCEHCGESVTYVELETSLNLALMRNADHSDELVCPTCFTVQYVDLRWHNWTEANAECRRSFEEISSPPWKS